MGVAVTAVVTCCAASFVAARVADKMYGHLRVTVIGLLGLSSVFFLWFLLLSTRVITPSLGNATLYIPFYFQRGDGALLPLQSKITSYTRLAYIPVLTRCR